MNKIGLKWLREHWREALDQVEYDKKVITATYRDQPVLSLLPVETWKKAVSLIQKLTGEDLSNEPIKIDSASLRNDSLLLRQRAKEGKFTEITRWNSPVAVATPAQWYLDLSTTLEAVRNLGTK